MGILLIAIFSGKAQAAAGAKVLRALHAEGALSLYASAVFARDEAGHAIVARLPVGDGAVCAPALGAALGAAAAFLGGPLTAAMRTAGFAMVQALRDFEESGLDADLLEEIARALRPGAAALLAEIEEDDILTLDLRIALLGGRTLRRPVPAMAVDALLRRRVQVMLHQLALADASLITAKHAVHLARSARPWRSLKLSLASTGTPMMDPDESGEALLVVKRATLAELARLGQQLRAQAGRSRREAAAKAVLLRTQAVALQDNARFAVNRRAAAVRARLLQRAQRLERIARGLTELEVDVALPVGALPRPAEPSQMQ